MPPTPGDATTDSAVLHRLQWVFWLESLGSTSLARFEAMQAAIFAEQAARTSGEISAASAAVGSFRSEAVPAVAVAATPPRAAPAQQSLETRRAPAGRGQFAPFDLPPPQQALQPPTERPQQAQEAPAQDAPYPTTQPATTVTPPATQHSWAAWTRSDEAEPAAPFAPPPDAPQTAGPTPPRAPPPVEAPPPAAQAVTAPVAEVSTQPQSRHLGQDAQPPPQQNQQRQQQEQKQHQHQHYQQQQQRQNQHQPPQKADFTFPSSPVVNPRLFTAPSRLSFSAIREHTAATGGATALAAAAAATADPSRHDPTRHGPGGDATASPGAASGTATVFHAPDSAETSTRAGSVQSAARSVVSVASAPPSVSIGGPMAPAWLWRPAVVPPAPPPVPPGRPSDGGPNGKRRRKGDAAPTAPPPVLPSFAPPPPAFLPPATANYAAATTVGPQPWPQRPHAALPPAPLPAGPSPPGRKRARSAARNDGAATGGASASGGGPGRMAPPGYTPTLFGAPAPGGAKKR